MPEATFDIESRVLAQSKDKGLCLKELDKRNKILIDPDNVFWGIFKQKSGSELLIQRNFLSLYDRLKQDCDREMEHFRFNTGLTAVYIDPTDRCNADCPYCYVPAKIRTRGQSMTEEQLDFVLTKAAVYFKEKKRKAVIVFHASEPLLVKEIIFKEIDKFKDEFYFGIQTNALLLKEEDTEFIKSRKVSIGISLDASDKTTNNFLRRSRGGPGNFQKAVQAIEWFRGYKGLNVITTITKVNVDKLAALVRFLHNKGVGCVLINPLRLTQKNSRCLRPDDMVMAKNFIKAVEAAMECSKNSENKIIIGNFANIILGIAAPSSRRLMCDISPCGGGRCFFTITASGKMIPCGEFIGLKRFSGGNIFRDSIASAMESVPFKSIRSRFVEKIPECNACLLRNICGSPCPAELHSFGNMHKKAVFCEFYKEIIAFAFKLIAEGKEKYCFRGEGLNNLEYEYHLKGAE